MGSMAYDSSLNPAPRSPTESGVFNLGDMVWGAVRSHPWWPGQIYNEALALPAVRASKLENHLLVAFFGDSSYGWLLPADLLPFAPHFPDLSKQSRSRNFLNAVDDAVDEVCRRAALGLTNNSSFGPSRLPGYAAVRVTGYEPCEYSVEQVEESRRKFVPGEVVECVSELAVGPWRGEVDSVDRIRLKATLLAYRRAVFKGIDVEAQSAIEDDDEDDGKDLSSKKQQEQRKLPRSSHSKRSISDLTAIARRRRQSEELQPTRPTAIANVVSVRPGGQPGKANALNTKQKRPPAAAVATGLEIPATLQSGDVLDSESPAKLEPGSVKNRESKEFVTRSSTMNMNVHGIVKKVKGPKLPLENPKSQIVTTKRPLENPKPQNVTAKRLKRERSPLETKLDSPPRKSIAQAQETHDVINRAAAINKTEAPAREPSAELISPGSEDDKQTDPMLVESKVVSASSDEEEWTGATLVKSKLVSDRSDGEEQADAKLVKSIPVSVCSEVEVVKSSPISLPSLGTDTSTRVPEFKFSQLLGDFRSLAINHFYEADRNTPAIVKHAFERFRSVVYRKSLRDQPPRRDVLPPSTAESGPSPVPPKAVMEIVVPETARPKSLPEISTSREVHTPSGAELGPTVPPKDVQEMGGPTKSLPDDNVHPPSIIAESALSPAPLPAVPEINIPAIAGRKRVGSKQIKEPLAKRTKRLETSPPQSVAPSKPKQLLESGSKKDVDSAVVSLKSSQQLDSRANKDVGSAMPSLKSNPQLESGAKKDVDSAVVSLKPSQQLDSRANKDVGSAVPSLKSNPHLESGAKKDVDSAVVSLKSSQQLDSRAKKDVGSAVPSLKSNPQLKSGAKNDVGIPVVDAGNEKAEESVKPNQQRNPTGKKEEGSAVASLKPNPNQQPDSGSKMLTQQKTRTASPTYLMMTFPAGVKLPALPYIKTMFGGLGQIDASGTAVNLKTNSCRVLFKYKSDAESAFKYVESRQVFGEAKVVYRLKDAALPSRPPVMPQQPKPSPKNAISAEAVTTDPVRDATLPARQPAELPQKPGLKVGQTEPSVSEAIKMARAARQRVELEKKMASVKKVALGKEAAIAVKNVPLKKAPASADMRDAAMPARELQKPKATLKNVGGVENSVSASARDVTLPTRPVSEVEKVEASFKVALGDGADVLLPARQPAELPKPCIKKAVDKAWATKEVRFSVGSSENVRPLSPPQASKGVLGSSPAAVASAVPLGYKGKVDISSQMMDLLLKCNEVVGAVKMSLGYVPYHTI